MRPVYSLPCLILGLACSSPTPAPKARPQASAPSPAPAKVVVADPRSPADFGKQWAEVAVIQDEAQKRLQALSLIETWEGRQYEWDGYVMFSLCNEAQRRCAANVIERKQLSNPELLGGFFPTLSFTETGFSQLRQACKGKTGCVVRFRGVLSALRTDPEFPLGMDFTEVAALSGRDPSPAESWWKEGPSFALPEDFKPSAAPLADPKEPPLPPLKVKIVEKTF